jgi:outer membrane receptor protein involved in Fe transport
MYRRVGVILLALALLPALLLAGTTGKIKGKVIDRENGDALPGANVAVVGTTLGGAADLNGEYFILNLPAGTYELRASFIGYQTVTIKSIRVVADLTEEINFALASEAIEAAEIIITAERPIFEKNATNTVRIVDAEQLSQLPVRGAVDAVSLQAGVVVAEGSGGVGNNPVLNVRGGRGNEASVIVDGVLQNDPLMGVQSGQISSGAIEQVSAQLGGFEAKFGQAQSAVINITTKRGASRYAVGGEMISSELTDDYGYNIYNMSISGPILPGNDQHTFFALGERNYFSDGNPSALGLRIPTANINRSTLPGNTSDLYRFSLKTTHTFGDLQAQLSGNGSLRNGRVYIHNYAKNAAHHIPRFDDDNFGGSVRLTYTLSPRAFMNLTGTYRSIYFEQGDPLFFDNLEAYGDTLQNAELRASGIGQGARPGRDGVGVFFDSARLVDNYIKQDVRDFGLNIDMTSQVGKHLLEVGAGFLRHKIHFWNLSPVRLANGIRDNPDTPANEADFNADGVVDASDREARFLQTSVFNTYYGFTPTGEKDDASARKPIEAYFYLQDKIELKDLVLNLGLRFDYFDAKSEKLRNRQRPFAFGNSQIFDDEDFVPTEAEYDLAPRIGLGFPVTDRTIFHAQYGKFIQRARLIDLYWSRNRFDQLLTDSNFTIQPGDIESERTTQYEAGLRQTLGDNVALDITAFYKDVQGLVNITTNFFLKGNSQLNYLAPTNTDFGTVKGLAVKFDMRRTNYLTLSFDYTYSLAEGTGSSQVSSFTAAFRNNNGEVPKAIAPLDFDQRHTLVGNVDFRIPQGEGGPLETLGANLLISYNSGRPYTPLETQDVLANATNFGDTRGYVNSAYGPGAFRLDLKVDRTFDLGRLRLIPYFWVINLTDEDNAVTVYRSTGDEFSSGFLETPAGRNAIAGAADPVAFVNDYKALEQNPANFGVPRQIRLGLKVNFQ